MSDGASGTDRAEGLREAVEKELACPVDWSKIIPEDGIGLVGDMESIWEQMVAASELPSSNLIDPVMLAIADEDDLDWALTDIRAWVGDLRAAYEKRVYPFSHLKFADRAMYPKHYPAAGLSRADIVERTLTSDSLFFQEFTSEVLTRYMWNVFEMHNRSPMLTEQDESFVVDTRMEVGASKGLPTTFVRILFNRASGVVHMYPVPRDAASADEILVVRIEHLLPK